MYIFYIGVPYLRNFKGLIIFYSNFNFIYLRSNMRAVIFYRPLGRTSGLRGQIQTFRHERSEGRKV